MICMCTYLSACARHEHVGRLFRFFLQPKLLDCFAFDGASSSDQALVLLAIVGGLHLIIVTGSAKTRNMLLTVAFENRCFQDSMPQQGHITTG